LGPTNTVERGRYWERTGWNPTLGAMWGGYADLARQAVGAPQFEPEKQIRSRS
jgi:hypothetical protein